MELSFVHAMILFPRVLNTSGRSLCSYVVLLSCRREENSQGDGLFKSTHLVARYNALHVRGLYLKAVGQTLRLCRSSRCAYDRLRHRSGVIAEAIHGAHLGWSFWIRGHAKKIQELSFEAYRRVHSVRVASHALQASPADRYRRRDVLKPAASHSPMIAILRDKANPRNL